MRLPILPCLLSSVIVLAGGLQLAAAEAVVEDFTGEAKRTPVVFQEPEHATIAVAAAPTGEPGKALAVDWHEWSKGYLDFAFGRNSAAPGLAGGVHGTIAVRLYLAPGTALRSASLRLTDAGGETFQWPITGELARSGWRTVLCAVDPASATGHWGGDLNGRIDPPLHVAGFALSPLAPPPSTGGIAIGAISTVTAP